MLNKFHFLILGTLVVMCAGSKVQDLANKIKVQYCPLNGFNVSECQGASPKAQLGVAMIHEKLSVMLGVTIDATTGEIKVPVIKPSYDKKQTYTSDNGIVYDVPDQVTVSRLDVESHHEDTRTFKKFPDLIESFSDSLTMRNGMHSFSIDKYRELSKRFSDKTSMTFSTMIFNAFHMSFNEETRSNPILIDYFVEALKTLPVEFDAKVYLEFLELFGTDVVMDADCGGIAEQLSVVSTCFIDGVNVDDQAQLRMLKALYGLKYAHTEYVAGFESHTKADVLTVRGGDPADMDFKKWGSRVDSFTDNPVFTKVKLMPLYKFVDNTVIAANLKKATEIYTKTHTEQTQALIDSWRNTYETNRRVYMIAAYNQMAYSGANVKQFDMKQGQSYILGPLCNLLQIHTRGYFECVRRYNSGAHQYECDRVNDVEPIENGYYANCYANFNYGAYCNIDAEGNLQAVVGSMVGAKVKSGCSIATISAEGNRPYYSDKFDPYYHKNIYCCYSSISVEKPTFNGLGNIVTSCPVLV
jgi:hypothetical protein